MENNIKEVVYSHVVLEGTSYEIGRMEGEFLKKHHPEQVSIFHDGSEFIKPISREKANRAFGVFEKYCPHINEEIKGLSESLGISEMDLIHYAFSYVSKGNCSHFALMPSMTKNNHMYVGRSYEWNSEDELRLMTIRAKGMYSHMGFSLLLLGRFDGINEHGLCVTMSNAIPLEQSEEEGLRFWMVIRILLDKCKTVKEAIKLIKELPISAFCNLIITDKLQNAVLVEIYNSNIVLKKIDENSQDTYVCSTNFYTLEGMEGFVRNKMNHSVYRYNSIVNGLDNRSNLTREDLLKVLSTTIPEGLACHYYDYYLGTLWSMLYDVTDNKIEICFGSPAVNKWYTMDLNASPGVTEYTAVFPLEKADDIMWKIL